MKNLLRKLVLLLPVLVVNVSHGTEFQLGGDNENHMRPMYSPFWGGATDQANLMQRADLKRIASNYDKQFDVIIKKYKDDTAGLQREREALDTQHKNAMEAIEKKYDGFFPGARQALGSKIPGATGGGWKTATGSIVTLLVLLPVLQSVSDSICKAISGVFSKTVVVAFKRFFWGVNYKVGILATHCKNLFTAINDLVKVLNESSGQGVQKTMSIRTREDLTEEAEKEAQEKSAANDKKKCAVCEKEDGRLECFFECPLEKHALHARCLMKKLQTNRFAHMNCPVCKASRKLEFMQPDLNVAATIDRIGSLGQGASIVISARVAQKRIDSLLKTLEKSRDDNSQIIYGELIALRENLRQVCQLLEKKESFKDFCAEEFRSKLLVFARLGLANASKLGELVSNVDSEPGDKQPRYGGFGHAMQY